MQKKLPLDQIDTGVRARNKYSKIEELWESIKQNGLISPIAVIDKKAVTDWEDYNLDELDPNKPYLLLAGGRRYYACRHGKMEKVPTNIYTDERDLVELKRIELYENLDREALEWVEEVKLKKQIHDLEGEIAESQGDKASVRSTARKLSVSHGNLSEDLNLADAIELIPDLGKHKNKSDAKKELKQMMKQVEDRKKVEEIKKKKGNTRKDIQSKVADSYKNMDIMTGLSKFDNETVNFIELDPPLKIGFEDNDRYDHASYNEVSDNSYLVNMREWLTECYRVMKENSWIVVWYPIEPWHQPVLELMQDVGFKTRGIPLMWDKGSGQTRSAQYNLGNAYEVAFYGRKGKPELEQMGRSNIFSFKKPAQSKRYHPTEKPIELYEEILKTFCRKGYVTVSGFGGSGNMVLAAHNLNINCVAFDTSNDWKNKFDLKAHEQVPPNYSSYR